MKTAVFLTWHVDYWDRLGWKDPFAKKEFTDRQNRYAAARAQKQTWTPQFVVDGDILPNEKTGAIPQVVTRACETKSALSIDATAKLAGGKITVAVRLRPSAKDWKPGKDVGVLPVLFRRKAETSVPKGENQGRTLTESYVALATAAPLSATDCLAEKGTTASFDLPKDLKAADIGVALLVEDTAAARALQCVAIDVTEPAPTPAPDGKKR